MEHQQSNPPNAIPGLFTAVTTIAKNFFGLLLNRIELAALELSEVRTTILKLLVLFGLGLIVAWFAIAYWSILLVVLAWPTMGWKILLIVAAGFTLAAIVILFYARSLLAQGKLSMPTTMAELRNDRDALL